MKAQILPTRTQIKHAAILEAAKEVFLLEGYSLASMDNIAKLANVSKRTIYDHFETKEKLFQAVLKDHWHNLLYVDAHLFDLKNSLKKNLEVFAQNFMKFLYQPDTIAFFRLLIAEGDKFSNLITALVVDEKPPFTRILIAYLKEARQAGQINIKHLDLAAAYFMGLLKEYHFWPMLMGIYTYKKPKNIKWLIKEAIKVFIQTYK